MRVLRLLVRILGTAQILLGLLFWSGNAYSFLQVHMLLGLALVLLLWAAAIIAARNGEQPPLVTLGLLWGIVVPVLGMTQAQLLPGDAHWIIRVLHLLVGVFAIGLVEVLATRMLAHAPARTERTMAMPADT
jgi:hypothetical protein